VTPNTTDAANPWHKVRYQRVMGGQIMPQDRPEISVDEAKGAWLIVVILVALLAMW
jgi:hypothetical protein